MRDGDESDVAITKANSIADSPLEDNFDSRSFGSEGTHFNSVVDFNI